MTNNLKKLTADTFQEHLNTDFTIMLQGEDEQDIAYVLTLVQVERVGEAERDIAAHGRESFSLIFKNPHKEQYLYQGMYALQHTDLENITLFVVPLGPRDDGMYYEIIFT